MNTRKSILLLVVCTCLALGLIIGLAPAPVDTGGEPATGADATADTTYPPDHPLRIYSAAKRQLLSAAELGYTYTHCQTRLVGGETYSETRSGTAGFLRLHSDDVEALVQEQVNYGSYSAHFTESYLDGRGYCQVRGTSFACDMTSDAFQARQVPAVLINEKLYRKVEMKDRTITFSDAAALERWANPTGLAELINATGTVTVDQEGRITAASYTASYSLGTTTCTLAMDLIFTEVPALTHPEYPESCAVLSDLEIPRHMLRTVDGVYSTRSASAEYTEAIHFGVLQENRTKTGGYCFHGEGAEFLANLNYHNSRTTTTGGSSAASQNNTFRDGQYSCSSNGAEPYIDSTYTAQNIRALCDDSILSAMMTLEHIAGAEITESGDFIHISFRGNDAFLQYFCGNIYTAMGLDTSLDALAESGTVQDASGYLVISKYTGLPTAMGLSLARSHVLGGVSYDMSYRLDQAVTLSCPDAFETITGEAKPQAVPGTVKPPFYLVTGENGEKMWLLASTNVGDDRSASLPSQILDALAASDALALEYDPLAFLAAAAADPALQSQLSALYYYSDGTTADHLSKEVYSRLYPLMEATGYAHRVSLKPVIWLSQIEDLYLTQCYGLSGNIGCDGYLVELAREQALPVYEMESGLSKLQSLTDLPDEVQELLLRMLLKQGMQGYYDAQLLEYVRWCSGDVEGLLAGMEAVTKGLSQKEKDLYAQYHQALVEDRTQIMLQAMEGYLQSGETVFCTVDLHNLLHSGGILESLENMGYTVEPFQYQ